MNDRYFARDQVAMCVQAMRMAMDSLQDLKPWLAKDDVASLEAVGVDIAELVRPQTSTGT